MYKSKIFLVGEEKDNLIALEETEYMTESILQDFLEKYPDLLPGDQIDPEHPRRWLLVAREMGVPGDVNESGRWSLDHLFLDQDGIPTFVECKRSSDTRIRREVVAQMLDYAANGIEYWTMERIRQSATETAQYQEEVLDEKIIELIGEEKADIDIEQYWKQVEANLRNHRVRLVFVADSTPKELRRLIEFLNEEMTHVEVLAVEIKQFQRENRQGQKALVPRVIGITETARSVRENLAQKKYITRQELLDACHPESRELFQTVFEHAEGRGYTIYLGTQGFSLRIYSPKSEKFASFVYGYPPNKFQIYLHENWILDDERGSSLRQELLKFNVFEEGGNYTLTAYVTQENVTQIKESYAFICEKVEEHVKAHQALKDSQ